MSRDNLEPVDRLKDLWPDTLPEAERRAFVALTPERQQIALERLGAFQELRNGSETPANLMRRLDLSRTQFYKLAREWKASESLTSLVPHSRPPKVRASRIEPGVVELCRQILREHATLSIEEIVSETHLIREVQARALKDHLRAPADTSVCRLIARLCLEDPELQLSPLARGQKFAAVRDKQDDKGDDDPIQFTQVFGGRLLVDHSTVDIITASDAGSFRPTISLVVDDATRLILAFRLVARVPEADDTLNVLALAAGGYQRFREKGISAVPGLHPVLTMRTGMSAPWKELRAIAENSRFKFAIRQAPEAVFGHLLRRSMITDVGGLKLLPRSTMLQPGDRMKGNNAGRAVLPWPDALTLVETAIAQHNAGRLLATPDGVLTGTGRGATLRLNTERKDWLEYGLTVFREAWSHRVT